MPPKSLYSICLSVLLVAGLAGCKRGEKPDAAKPGETNSETAAGHDKKGDEKSETKEEKAVELIPVSHDTNGQVVLTVSPEIQKRIALSVGVCPATEHAPEFKAYGSVLDPSPLITAHGEMAASEASIAALRVIAQRTRALFDAGENVSRKSLESAEADLQQAQIKAQTAQRQLVAEWGETIAKLDSTNRQDLVDKLAQGAVQLIRVDLYAGENVDGLPKSARVTTLSSDQWAIATVLSGVAKTDPKTQGQGFILRLDKSGAGIHPGSAITAMLQLGGESVKGALIPRSAILRFDSKTWVYVAKPDNRFVRREVSLDFPMDSGWFTSGGVSPGEQVVVESAQILLSEEQKSQIKAD